MFSVLNKHFNCHGVLRSACWFIALTTATAPDVFARGVSPYLPVGMSPDIERQIERVLILAGKPVVRRPIPAAVVLDALPEACAIDAALCQQVRGYLRRYQTDFGVTQLQAELALSAGDSDRAIPNAHGRTTDSRWQFIGEALYQPSDYLLLGLGGMAYDGRAMPVGSVLSAGFDFAQLDIGFRDHWLSPMSTSSMLISSEAPTMPSVTLSNYRPIGPMGFSYELFSARMSKQDGIRYYDTTTSGEPRLAGVQFGLEPVTGYALTFNKLMQYGGGARGGRGLSDLRKALLDSNSNINLPDGTNGQEEFGNQIAAVTGTMQFPGKLPFSVSIEYAGEDNSYSGNYRLGDTALSLGIDFPQLWQRFDAKYEVTEWQNVWYTHHLYPKGMTNKDYVLGHWFGDQRQFGDAVGGRSHEVQFGVRTDAGTYWQGIYRTMAFVSSVGFQTVPEVPYKHLHEIGLRYSTAWAGRNVTAEFSAGQDAFEERFARLSASIDLIRTAQWRNQIVSQGSEASANGYDVFVDFGVNRSRVFEELTWFYPYAWTPGRTGVHLGFGARRAVSKRNDLGMRVELDRVNGRNLLSLRAVDYRLRLFPQLAAAAFFGVGRYDYGAPAFGWYGGLGVQVIDIWPKWDVGLDWRRHDKLSRNRVLPDDPRINVYERPRMHFDTEGHALYLSRRF